MRRGKRIISKTAPRDPGDALPQGSTSQERVVSGSARPDSGGHHEARSRPSTVVHDRNLREQVAALAATVQILHDNQSSRIAVDNQYSRSQPHMSDVPLSLKIAGAALTVILASGAIIGFVWNTAISPINTRLVNLESVVRVSTSDISRLSDMLGEIRNQLTTGARLRDQEGAANKTRLDRLESNDAVQQGQNSVINNNLAGFQARLEDIQRRLARIEDFQFNRRPSNESDTVFPNSTKGKDI